jgi:hypothetical protein
MLGNQGRQSNKEYFAIGFTAEDKRQSWMRLISDQLQGG